MSYDKRLIDPTFSHLDKKLIQSVPKVRDDAEMVAAGEMIRQLEAQSKEVQKQIDDFYVRPGEPAGKKTDIHESAQRLLDGGDIETLSTFTPSEEREKLHHKKQILTAALEQKRNELRAIEVKAANRVVEQITPEAKKIAGAVIKAFEKVKETLEIQYEFYSLLSTCGVRPRLRPPHWDRWPFEDVVFFGTAQTPNINYYLENKKTFWEL